MSHPGNEHNDERSERVEMDRESMLTMYALGELQADAAAEIEASLADDPAGRAFVASTRGTAALLEASLASENSENAVLTKRQRESVINGPVVEPSTVLRFPGWPRLAAAALAAAACVTLIVTALMVHDGGGSDRGGEMAMKMGEGLEEFGALDDESGPLAAGTAAAPGVSRKRANGEPDLAAVGRDADVVESMIATEPKNDGRRRRDAFVGAPVDSRVDDNAVANGTATTAAAAPPASEPVAAPPASPPKPGGGGGGGGAISGGRSGGNAETPARRRAPSASPNAGRRTEMPRIEQERETRGRTRDIGRGEREQELDREGYAPLTDNAFKRPTVDEYSTFSVDVDTASFSNARRMIDEGRLPPKDAVRIEEFINAFDYDYAEPAEDAPFAIDLAVAPAPWAPDHRLVRIGLKGREIEPEARPATSLVFLVDTSGSMNRPNKLPLVQESLRMLVHALHGDDRIAIVTYAGTSGVALPSTYCMEKERLLDAIHHLRPGGSTNGAAGIQLAYDIAQQHFIEGGVNRVILCTDGDFNVGASSDGELVDLIARKRESGVFLNVLGYGTGNFQDAKMEALSNNGNGMFAYIDSRDEAKRVLVEKMAGTLVTIAKDVKIQVEFNPAQVGAYRLIGYANRLLEARDFNDDRKDAGEIGAGHTVTALYEVIPAGLPLPDGEVDDLEFQKARELVESDAMLLVKLRYKAPDGDVSTLITRSLIDGGGGFEAADADFRLASAAAAFGMVLRESEYRGTASFDSILALLGDAIDDDRAAFARPEMLDDLDRRVVREDEAAPRGADTMEGLAADAVPTSATRREESLEQLKRLVKAARAMTEAREATRDGAGHDRP